jgi:hypothetical protein
VGRGVVGWRAGPARDRGASASRIPAPVRARAALASLAVSTVVFRAGAGAGACLTRARRGRSPACGSAHTGGLTGSVPRQRLAHGGMAEPLGRRSVGPWAVSAPTGCV